MTTHQDFDLCLEKTETPNEFVAYTPDGDGGRAAEHAFSLRIPSRYARTSNG